LRRILERADLSWTAAEAAEKLSASTKAHNSSFDKADVASESHHRKQKKVMNSIADANMTTSCPKA
jgi:hypothetical protein